MISNYFSSSFMLPLIFLSVLTMFLNDGLSVEFWAQHSAINDFNEGSWIFSKSGLSPCLIFRATVAWLRSSKGTSLVIISHNTIPKEKTSTFSS